MAAFLAASLILALIPGPAVLYLVTRTLAEGRRAGFASVVGIALGNFGNLTATCLGLAALLSASAAAFTVLRAAGALYLILLGIKALRRRPPAVSDAPAPAARGGPLRSGFWVALLNPKTALFFAAFLPQFLDARRSPLAASLALGSVFVAIAMCTDALYVLAAGALAPILRRRQGVRRYGRYLAAATFFGLGLYAAFAGSRSRQSP